jgi:hypothetical protein
MDPDPGGPKTSGSPTLIQTIVLTFDVAQLCCINSGFSFITKIGEEPQSGVICEDASILSHNFKFMSPY